MPIRVVDVDLAALEDLPALPRRYDAVRLLVHDGGRPLGYVQVPNPSGPLESRALTQEVAAAMPVTVWADRALRRRQQDPDKPAAPVRDIGMRPRIGVVVCTRKRPDDLTAFLEAVSKQTYPNYEVVVVDNAPGEGSTRAIAARFGAQYVAEPRQGLDFARNAGWRHTRAEIVAYADDDTRPDPGWLGALAEGFAVPDVQAVTGLVVPAELETRAQVLYEDVCGGMGWGFRSLVFSSRGRELSYVGNQYGIGANMAFRRNVLEALGGFDPALGAGTPTAGGDEFDMFQRIVEADGAIWYRPDAVVRHVHRRTISELRRQLFNGGRGFAAFHLAAFGRARGFDRVRVVRAYFAWLRWLVVRTWRRLRKRDQLPLHLRLPELAGALAGPLFYVIGRRRARRLLRRTNAEPV